MRRLAPIVAALALLVAAAPAAAHVDVLPTTVSQGEAVEFVVRVPTEREVPTTRVRIEVPDEVTVFSFLDPPPGWRLDTVPGSDGRVRAVVYSGGRIAPGRYAEFRMLGTPFGVGETVWPARQTYGDGQVKPWTGPPEDGSGASTENGPTDPGPAARVEIVDGPVAAAGPVVASEDEGSGAAVWLGVIAIAIAALSATAVGFLWSTRPARLPGDDEDGR